MMFRVEWVGVGFLIADGVVFIVSLIITWCCDLKREDYDARPARLDAAEPPPVWRVPVRTHVASVMAAPAFVAEKLGYFPYSAGRRASEKLVCTICLEVFEHGTACSEVPDCRHLFHRDCIGAWMKSTTTCPLCRRSIVTGSEQVPAADDIV